MSSATHVRGPRRLVQRMAATRPLAWLSARVLHRLDRTVYRWTRGRTTFSDQVSGLPIVMLTTTGARTGRPRTLPVVGLPDGDGLVVIASNFGQRRHPAWYHNLRAHPLVSVTVGGVTREYAAREVGGAERDRYYEYGIEVNPGWAQYGRRTGDRRIPVIRLDLVQRSKERQ
jgi:deazaflavin-dependent oxidoreductase (nitroreductase family)